MSTPEITDYPLGLLISVANRTLDDRLETTMHAAGFPDVRRAHGVVFEALDAEGTRLTVMAARARMTKQAMGELVDYLEDRGYLTRERDPTDRRAKLVVLTPKGWEAVRAGRAALARVDAEWAAYLGERRARAFRTALADVCTRFAGDHLR